VYFLVLVHICFVFNGMLVFVPKVGLGSFCHFLFLAGPPSPRARLRYVVVNVVGEIWRGCEQNLAVRYLVRLKSPGD
jgi:hypothetical protein